MRPNPCKPILPAVKLGILLLAAGCLPGYAMDAADAPDELELGSMTNLYEPVSFDHALHTEIAGCARCHHHTTGTGAESGTCGRCHDGDAEGETVSCVDCHPVDPFSAGEIELRSDPRLYHIDRPGLKGAYHLNCVGCHHEEGGPTGCRDCHAMTGAGEKRFAITP